MCVFVSLFLRCSIFLCMYITEMKCHIRLNGKAFKSKAYFASSSLYGKSLANAKRTESM